MDAANVDLKGFSEYFYQHLCLAHLQPTLDSLEYLVRETNVWLEITNLIIPRENDDPQMLRRCANGFMNILVTKCRFT